MKKNQIIRRVGFLHLFLFLVTTSFTQNVSTNSKTGSFTDSRDGKTYKTVQIGNQVWMTENLAYYGGNGCWAFNNDEKNIATYGRLYTWDAAKAACPTGWHLPTDNEWKQLEMAIGMSQSTVDDSDWRGTNEGIKLKATSYWNSNGNGTDDFSFSGLPGGFRATDGRFEDLKRRGGWWTSTEIYANYAWTRYLLYAAPKINRGYFGKDFGCSVRCVRD